MTSRRTLGVLYEHDPVFQDFATRILGAENPDQAWEMLYTPGGISKMSPEPSEVHVRSGGFKATGRKRRIMDERAIQKGLTPTGAVAGAKKAGSFFQGVRPVQAAIGTTMVAGGLYGGMKAKKQIGNKVRGYELIQGKRPVEDTRPNPAFGKSMDAKFNVVKTDEDKHQVFGWASVIEKDGMPVLDKQGDLIEVDDMENSAYKFVLENRKGGQQHKRNEAGEPVHVSDMIESFVLTPEKKEKMGLPQTMPTGWWVGFKVKDEDTWQDIKNGKVNYFSVHGRGKRTPVTD